MPFTVEESLLESQGRKPEPAPFDIDLFTEEYTSFERTEEQETRRRNFARAMEPLTRPFVAQGYGSLAALNRGTAALWSHLDSIADFIEMSSGMKSEGLFEKMAEIAADNSEYWQKRAEDVGITFVDEIVSEAVGAGVPGVTQFALDVGSGFTFPYMSGAGTQGQEILEAQSQVDKLDDTDMKAAMGLARKIDDEPSPFEVGIMQAAKTATLDGLFKMMRPLKPYLKAPAFGTVFGTEEAAIAPEGQKAKAFAKGAAIGAIYSAASPGGQMGLNEVKRATKEIIADLQKMGESGQVDISPSFVKSLAQGALKRFRITIPKLESTEQAIAFGKTATKDQFIRMKEMEENLRYLSDQQRREGMYDDATKSATAAQFLREAQEVAPKESRISDSAWDRLRGQRGGITIGGGEKGPRKRQRMFLKTLAEAREIDPTLREKVADIDPQHYFQAPNAETLAIGRKYIDKHGMSGALEFARGTNEGKKISMKDQGGIYMEAIREYQRIGDLDRAAELGNEVATRMTDAGQFTQLARIWDKIHTAPGFIHWANKELARMESKYGWADTIIKRKPESFRLTGEEQKFIYEKFKELEQIKDPTERADVNLEMIDMVAQKVPPSVSEIIDVYRRNNMLSGPATFLRNLLWNVESTFVTRPFDIATQAGIDWVGSSLSGKPRQMYMKDVPVYYKAALNSTLNGARAYMDVMRMKRPIDLEKYNIGDMKPKTELDRARSKQIPRPARIVLDNMEATDMFLQTMISAGELTRQMKNGVPEMDAYHKGVKLAKEYLLRDKYELNDPRLSYMSQAVNALSHGMEYIFTLPKIGKPATWYIPFLRTPTRVGVQMIEHSPLGAIRAPEKWSQEAGAKILSGTIMTTIGTLMAMTGDTTWSVPTSQEGKRLFYLSGRVPYSIRVMGTDTWIPLWYFGPYALAMGMPAAAQYYWTESKKAPAKNDLEKMGDMAFGLGQFIGQQTSTQSIGALFSVLNGDIDYSFWSQTAFTSQQILPASGFVRYVNTWMDDIYRKPSSFSERIMVNLPGLSKRVEAHTDLYLKPVRRKKINYFLPYRIGEAEERYDAQYRRWMKQSQDEYVREKNMEKLMRGTKKYIGTPGSKPKKKKDVKRH